MKKFWSILWSKKWLILLVLIVAFVIYRFTLGTKPAQEEEKVYTVQKGNVTKTIASTGKIQAQFTQDLTFGVQGRISELKVQAGDKVKKGDYLGSLDTTSLQAQLKIAQGGLQSASGNYNNAKQGMEPEIQDKTNEVALLDKQLAESNLEINKEINANTVSKTKLGLQIAQKGLDASEEALDNLEKEMDKAEEVSDRSIDVSELSGDEAEDLSEAQKELSQFQYDSRIEASQSQLSVDKLRTKQQQIDFNNTNLNTKSSDFLNQIGLDKAVKQVELGDLRKQQSEISKKNNLNVLAGQIANAQGSVELAKYNLSQAKLFAPIDGTILQMPLKVGEFFLGPQNPQVIQIGDLSRYKVETELNELDILDIAAGQKAIVEFEAKPGVKYDGIVEKINPAPLVDSTGVVNYKVELSLDSGDITLYHGLSVNVEIITEEKEDVIQIPFVAIQRKEDGQYVRVKGADGVISDKKVEIGVQSINNVEILSGLEAGDQIVY